MLQRRGEQRPAEPEALRAGHHGVRREQPHLLADERHDDPEQVGAVRRRPSSRRGRCSAGAGYAGPRWRSARAAAAAGRARSGGTSGCRARGTRSRSPVRPRPRRRASSAGSVPRSPAQPRPGATGWRRDLGEDGYRSSVRKVGVEEELLLVDPETGELANAAGAVLHEHRAERGDAPAPSPLPRPRGRAAPAHGRDPHRPLRRPRRDRPPAAGGTAYGDRGGRGVRRGGRGGRHGAAWAPRPRPSAPTRATSGSSRSSVTPGEAPAPSACTSTWTSPTTRRACRVIDGLRPWLPLLTALTSNSPYASGSDTGYASWRQQVWTRWPTAGTAEPYGTLAEYRRVRDTLIRARGGPRRRDALLRRAAVGGSYPTVEIRVSDTCTEVDDAVLAAALARALVETVAETTDPGEPVRSDLLRAAWWRAARYGLTGDLVHPASWDLVPAADALAALAEPSGPRSRLPVTSTWSRTALVAPGHAGDGCPPSAAGLRAQRRPAGRRRRPGGAHRGGRREVTVTPARPRRRCSTGLTP